MPILLQILAFIGMQLLKALLTAQAVKDATLFALKELAMHTKGAWEKQVYNRVKFYFTEDTSEHFIPQDQPVVQPPAATEPQEENKPQ